jgi:hypothetical protein
MVVNFSGFTRSRDRGFEGAVENSNERPEHYSQEIWGIVGSSRERR